MDISQAVRVALADAEDYGMVEMPGETTSAGRLRVMTMVDGPPVAGGGEVLAAEVAKRLDPERFDRMLCLTRLSPTRERESAVAASLALLRQAGVRVLTLNRRSSLHLWAWRPLLQVLRDERIDVLHAHKFGSNVWAAILGPLARTPVVIAHEHTWSYEGRPWRRFLDRELIARRCDAFVAVSRADERRMVEVEGISPSRVVFIPNGIPTPRHATDADKRAELGIGPDDPVIGTVGGLRPQKALHELVEAAGLLRRRWPRLRVLIVGGGSERKRLEELISRLGVGATVSLLGRRDDIPELLAALDVAVSCSEWEGSPLAVMEYMEAALPVVATRVGGVPDLIEDGVQGLLIAPGDPHALAEAIGELLADPMRRSEMGKRGRERRRGEFDLGVTVERLAQLYEQLHAAKRR